MFAVWLQSWRFSAGRGKTVFILAAGRSLLWLRPAGRRRVRPAVRTQKNGNPSDLGESWQSHQEARSLLQRSFSLFSMIFSVFSTVVYAVLEQPSGLRSAELDSQLARSVARAFSNATQRTLQRSLQRSEPSGCVSFERASCPHGRQLLESCRDTESAQEFQVRVHGNFFSEFFSDKCIDS